jgi:hypothetical protein
MNMEHITNGDHLRNMDDKDIMKWMMANLETDTICRFCVPTMRTENKCDGHCISGVLKWLQQPVSST